MTQIVVRGESVGAFVWRLPEDLAKKTEELPELVAKEMISELTRLGQSYCCMIIGVFTYLPATAMLIQNTNRHLSEMSREGLEIIELLGPE